MCWNSSVSKILKLPKSDTWKKPQVHHICFLQIRMLALNKGSYWLMIDQRSWVIEFSKQWLSRGRGNTILTLKISLYTATCNCYIIIIWHKHKWSEWMIFSSVHRSRVSTFWVEVKNRKHNLFISHLLLFHNFLNLKMWIFQ